MDWQVSFELRTYKPDDHPTWVGECTVQEAYLKAHIRLWPGAFEKSESLDAIIKHELCHILTAKTKLIAVDLLHGKMRSYQEIEDANEQLTERISRLI